MNVLEQLRARFAAATPEGGDPATFAAAVRASSEAKFGDYQANGCMAIAKTVKQPPRIVAEAVVSQEPRNDQSKRLFHLALLRKYGRPDLYDPTGMQWGQVSLDGGRRTLVRTLPMLESSNDEIIRLSDTGLGERQAGLGDPAAAPGMRHAGEP